MLILVVPVDVDRDRALGIEHNDSKTSNILSLSCRTNLPQLEQGQEQGRQFFVY